MKYLLLILMFFPAVIFAQNQEETQTKSAKDYLTLGENNKIINKYFGKIMGTGDNPDLIGNYASFVPVDGKFTFKGTMPIGKSDSKVFSYLGISLSGDILNDKVSALFTDSKLNTGTSIQAEYHIRFGKAPAIRNEEEYALYNYKTKVLVQEKINAQNEAKRYDFRRTQYLLDSIQVQKNRIDLADRKTRLDSLELAIQKLVAMNKYKTNALAINKLAVAFSKQTSEYDSLRKVYLLLATKNKTDSIFLADAVNITQQQAIIAGNKFRKKQDTLFSALELKGMSISWLSFIAATGIKKYYNFDTAATTYAKQLTNTDLKTYRFGVKYNKYWFNSLEKQFIYASLGLAYERDNNSETESTTTITEEAVYKNAAGDTTRKTSNKYTAYSKPLVETRKWGLSADFYFLFGERSSGFHIAPTIYKPIHQQTYIDLDVGYVVSFLNTKKDQPTINLEAYYSFHDLNNRTNTGLTFWKRNEIGIRVGLPFTLLIK